MHLDKTSDEEINNFFKKDKVLCDLGLQDDELAGIEQHGQLPKNPNSYWLAAFKDKKIVSLVRVELFSTLSVLCHIYVSSKFHKTGLLRKVKDMTVARLQKTTNFKHIIVPVPVICSHVIGPLESFGFIKVGHMKNILIWRGKEVDVLWYQLEIK